MDGSLRLEYELLSQQIRSFVTFLIECPDFGFYLTELEINVEGLEDYPCLRKDILLMMKES